MGQYIVVPEPQHAIAFRLQPACALLVVLSLLRMLAAIHFDYHAALETNEVHDEFANRLLAPELYAPNLPAPELLPEPLLRVRQFAAKLSRPRCLHPPS